MRSFILLAATALLPFFTGCRSGRGETNPQVEVNVIGAQAQQQGAVLAEKFARGLEKSLQTGDPVHWRAAMPPQLAKTLTKENFQELQKRLSRRYGKFQRASGFGMLNQGVVHYHLWKLEFLHKPAENAPAIPREGLIWIRILQEKGKAPALDYFGYMPF